MEITIFYRIAALLITFLIIGLPFLSGILLGMRREKFNGVEILLCSLSAVQGLLIYYHVCLLLGGWP